MAMSMVTAMLVIAMEAIHIPHKRRRIWIWMVGIPILISTPYGHDSNHLMAFASTDAVVVATVLMTASSAGPSLLFHHFCTTRGRVGCCCRCHSDDMICNM